MFFWVPTFLDFLCFGVPGGAILGLFRRLFGSPGPLKNQLKVCNYRQIQGFGPFYMEFFWSLDQEYVSMRFFLDLCDFVLFRGFNFGTFWHQKLWKTELRTCKKKLKNGYAIYASNSVPGTVGPLKKIRKQDNQTTRHWIEHALSCLAAWWRIYSQVGMDGHPSAQAGALVTLWNSGVFRECIFSEGCSKELPGVYGMGGGITGGALGV